MDFIERLRQLIENKSFTKTALHQKIGVSRETLDNYLKGKTSPTTEDVKKMSKRLGIVVSEGDGKIDAVTGMIRAYESTISSKDKELERALASKEAAIVRLEADKKKLWDHIDDLTATFRTAKQA